MHTNWQDVARAALKGSETGAMSFPQSVKMLMEAGFDGYAVDFRRSTRAFYMPGGEAIELATERTDPVAERFDAAAIKEAIREAQAQVPGYDHCNFGWRGAFAVAAWVAGGPVLSAHASTVSFYDVQILDVTPPDITATAPARNPPAVPGQRPSANTPTRCSPDRACSATRTASPQAQRPATREMCGQIRTSP
jgi:uncharacterized protein YbcV (DUF1398 family)